MFHSRLNDFGLLVALDDTQFASGEVFWDDGELEHVMSETYLSDVVFYQVSPSQEFRLKFAPIKSTNTLMSVLVRAQVQANTDQCSLGWREFTKQGSAVATTPFFTHTYTSSTSKTMTDAHPDRKRNTQSHTSEQNIAILEGTWTKSPLSIRSGVPPCHLCRQCEGWCSGKERMGPTTTVQESKIFFTIC